MLIFHMLQKENMPFSVCFYDLRMTRKGHFGMSALGNLWILVRQYSDQLWRSTRGQEGKKTNKWQAREDSWQIAGYVWVDIWPEDEQLSVL